MKQGNVDFKYSDGILCCKWYDNKAVLFSASNIEGIDTRSTVQRRMKDFSLSYLVYSILNGNLNLLIGFEIVIANWLENTVIVKEPPTPGIVKLKSANQAGSVNTPDHLAEYQVSRQQCMYCKT